MLTKDARPRITMDVVRHDETERAILISTDGGRCGAKWLRKADVDVQREDGARLTITLPRAVAVLERLAAA